MIWWISPGCSPAAGVRIHPESSEGSDTHVHPDGPRLPRGLDPLCNFQRMDLHEQGSCLPSPNSSSLRLLCQELSPLQPRHLCADEQTGWLFKKICSNSEAHLQARFYIHFWFALVFSSVTACWAQLGWAARWMTRARCLPARQRCLLCLKCREISLLPGHFPFYWLFDLEQSRTWNEWSSAMWELPSERLHQEQNQWTVFSNLLFERCQGKCFVKFVMWIQNPQQ